MWFVGGFIGFEGGCLFGLVSVRNFHKICLCYFIFEQDSYHTSFYRSLWN